MQNDDLPAPPPLPPPSSDGPRTRRAWPWVLLGAVVVSLLAVAFGLPLSSYIVSLPGPVKNVEDRVTIKGAKTYPSHGSLSLTTVSFRSDPTPALLLLAALDPNQTILSTHDLIQSGNYHQLLKQEQLQMQQSKRNAIETALDALGYKKATGDGARVVYVQGGSPASGYLNVGDVVHSINGHRITTACDVSHALAVHPAGAKARFKVDHKGKAENLGFHTVDNPDLPGKQAFAGIGITTDHYHYNPGVDVHIDTSNIGGPSAGTMMALTIYDRLTPGDLTGGKAIAGTGTIDPCEGDVGPIGGVQEKVVAASRQGVATFLAPAQDAPAARRADHGDMKIVTIHTFSQALHYLKSHS